MARYRMIAVDLDGTLLNDELDISPRTGQALRRAADKGILITIATGRMYCSTLPFARKLGIEAPIVTYQGALVKNTCSGEVLVNLPLPSVLAQEVLKEGYTAGVHMNVYFNDLLYVDHITPVGREYAEMSRVDIFPAGDLVDFVKDDPTKILFIADPDLLDSMKEDFDRKFAGRIYITKSKPYYLEIMHPDATKGKALKTLAERFGIPAEEVMVFGDSYNDLDMFRFAGISIAMGNAPGKVKEKADIVTATNNEDGIAEVIEKLVFQ